MLIVGIILTIMSLTGLVIIAAMSDGENEDMGFIIFVSISLCIGIFATLEGAIHPKIEKSLKDNTLEIEVRQEIINGQEISVDTVYIFTPKKEK